MPDKNDTLRPMGDADTMGASALPPKTRFQPAAPLKDEGVSFDPGKPEPARLSTASPDELKSAAGETSGSKLADAKQAIVDGSGKASRQAATKARSLADTGKEKAGGALDQLSQILHDTAGDVDEKFGEQYGHYARSAAGSVSSFADTVKSKNVDDLLDDLRDFARKSPGIAIGVAAALGFALARIAQSGIDSNRGS